MDDYGSALGPGGIGTAANLIIMLWAFLLGTNVGRVILAGIIIWVSWEKFKEHRENQQRNSKERAEREADLAWLNSMTEEERQKELRRRQEERHQERVQKERELNKKWQYIQDVLDGRATSTKSETGREQNGNKLP